MFYLYLLSVLFVVFKHLDARWCLIHIDFLSLQKSARLAYLNSPGTESIMNFPEDLTSYWFTVRARQTALWDFEEGGPTVADVAGTNYNPVVLDDAVRFAVLIETVDEVPIRCQGEVIRLSTAAGRSGAVEGAIA